ncbi:MAG TPA: inositol monophosphatase family protein [Pontiella sp.]
MELSAITLKKLSDAAIKAAKKAGQHIAGNRPQNVQRKDSGDCLASQVLTEVDKQSENLILETLASTLTDYDLALLTEERDDDGSRFEKDYFWCIDPIDGTLPFIENIPGYAVSIALVSRAGVPQLGVVFDPVEQNLYHAIKGQGAFKNMANWHLPQAGASSPSLITDRSFADQPCYPEIINRLFPSEISLTGGGVMNAIWVLERAPACYFKFPKPGDGGGCIWDFAATACIYNELGAVASDIHGNALELNRNNSVFMNHRGVLFASDANLAGRIRKLYDQLFPGK